MKEDNTLKKEKLTTPKRNRKGYIQVYTGKGKGKTTAALGLALRAAGHGMKTYIGQFLKGQLYGELLTAKKLSPLLRIEQFGRKGFIHVTRNPDEDDIKRAKRGLKKCLEAMLSKKYKIVILDEINVAVEFNLLTEKEVLAVLDQGRFVENHALFGLFMHFRDHRARERGLDSLFRLLRKRRGARPPLGGNPFSANVNQNLVEHPRAFQPDEWTGKNARPTLVGHEA